MIGSSRVVARSTFAHPAMCTRRAMVLSRRSTAATMLLTAAVLIATDIAPRRADAALAGMTRVASGLTSPIFATHAPGDSSRLFIALRGGAIRILDLTTPTPTLVATPFLTVPSIDAAGEGGFLGMAFHPEYAANGKFYTYSTHDNGGINMGGATSPFSTHIREWTVSGNPNVANTTFSPVMSFPRPQANHVGGWIGFSPTANDGNLYIMSGDGGGDDDNDAGHTAGTGNAQDLTNNFLGKALRINVNGDDFPADAAKNYAIPATNPFVASSANPAGDDEIWSYGLRNPFRASFDRATGDLWIGDVGQSAREEIDFEAANSAGGLNYGWRLREGTIATPTGGVGGAAPAGAINPVYEYDRDADSMGGTVVTGGYVYRGPDPSLQGRYFFADSRNTASTSDDNYWMFQTSNPTGTVTNIDASLVPNTGTAQFPASFGEDANGNLYILHIVSGEVYRINTNAFTAGDFNGDAKVDEADLAVWKTGFGTETGATRTNGDADADGDVDGRDFLVWQRNLGWSALNVGSPVTPVPEPTGIALTGVAAALVTMCRRRSAARASQLSN
jgi:glucose/arabinose dehydrogenase